MLEKQDLQAIKELIDTSITASEERMKSYVDGSIDSAIRASEERVKSYVDGSIDSAIRASENRTHAYIEGAIIPQLQLLAEGHQNILDTLAPKNRVEALEDEVVFIKSVMKAMSQEIAELKKAQ